MFLRNVQRWRGVILIAPVLVSTVVLGLSGQLVLYIHPRYIVFTVVLVTIASVLLVAAALTASHDPREDHEPDPVGRPKAPAVAGLVIAAVATVLMVALPPATLSSETASNRDLIGSSTSGDAAALAQATDRPSASFASFTVLEWAALLRQTQDPVFYQDKPVDVVGFITADPDGADDVFYVSRFKITCCAVDATPSAIPVYFPSWDDLFDADGWVHLSGTIDTNPSTESSQSLALFPATATTVDQPDDPYLY